MALSNFDEVYTPIARRGLTEPEAVEFLRREFPDISHWTIFSPPVRCLSSMGMIVGKGFQTNGTVGKWSWQRVSSTYPDLIYYDGRHTNRPESNDWGGVIKVHGPTGQEFLLFSFMDSRGDVGSKYLASTLDVEALRQFAFDVHAHFRPQVKDRIVIDVYGGSSVEIEPETKDRIYLPPEFQRDIEQQTFFFFEDAATYKTLGLPWRRGFLFVGEPGTGKTMLLRHLIRESHRRYQPYFSMLRINKNTDNDDIGYLWRQAERNAPAIVILEDMDSLSNESKITRSAFLAELDGIGNKNGLLVIGTTNHAAEVDPALIHRPSRFDRVWHFPLPDYKLRHEYLTSIFEKLPAETIDSMAKRTADWSFAYLKELRTTAAIISASQQQPEMTPSAISTAFDLLTTQFRAGQRHHAEPHCIGMGFEVA